MAALAVGGCSEDESSDPGDAAAFDGTVDMQAVPPDGALPLDRGPDTFVMPDAAVDMTGAPDMAAPDTTVPDAEIDMTGALDMATADVTVPDMVAPDMAADQAVPDMADPDMADPDMAADMAVVVMPDMAPPDMAAPDMAAPDMAAPDMADPCAMVACDAPPPPVCLDEGNLQAFEAAGTCDVVEGIATCAYAPIDVACAGGDICAAGACGPPQPPQPGELVITEFMPDPHGPLVDRRSQWVEIQNVSARPLPLAGCAVEVDRGSAALAGALAPGEVLLVGNGDDPEFNGNLPIAAVFNATISVRGGTLAIVCGPADPPSDVDRVVFARAPAWPVRPGFAVALDPESSTAVENDDPANWCLASPVYLDHPDDENRGSPGAANPACTQPVEFARLDRPAEAIGGPGTEIRFSAHLAHPGITDRSTRTDRSPLVLAQVGYGPDGSLPDASWAWFTAGANAAWVAPPDHPDLDEYQRLVELPDRGRYDIAWRFSVDAGRSWTLADGDLLGSTNGYQPDNAGDMRVEGIARVRGTGEVIISELFVGADVLDADAQWVELHNPGAEPLDLTGCTLDSPFFERSAIDGITIAANGWVAIPRVADPARNGGIESLQSFDFVLPADGGSIALTCRFEIDRIRWDDGVLFQPAANASLQLSNARLDAQDNDDAALWCPGDAVYDPPNGRQGTPGTPNRDCGALMGYPGPQLQVLFEAHCGDCHLNGQFLGDLSLDPFELNTFRIPAAQLPAMPLITPGDRQQSYLWHKLSATHFDLPDADGVQMPPGQPFRAGVIERIGLYVDELPIDAQP